MKTRVLKAAVGAAAVLGGLMVATPAQATDGPVAAQVYYPGTSGSGGVAKASLDFTSRTRVVYNNLTVRDVCPGDNLPVRAYVEVVFTNGAIRRVNMGSDTNGCGSDGTNLGDYIATGSSSIAKAGVRVCVYNSTQLLRCKTAFRDNPYT
ncbi:hypothetical protein [Kribbella deserti]|uniref:Secreted protein n=1 Tax=Kribbella deserti TaxID=1926257 RepID=A0ABV6QU56_9ACTN